MNAGAIEQVGTPAEVYGRPANRFVAEFIGDSNIFDLVVDRIEGERAYARRDGREPFEMVVMAKLDGRQLKPGAKVLAVLRPECITLGSPADASDNVASGEIVDAIFVGDAMKCRIWRHGNLELHRGAWLK